LAVPGKRIIKFLGLAMAGFMLAPSAFSQLPLYSQYMVNGFVINSAMAGYDGLTTINLNTRQQWLGIADAPRTISASFQTRVLKRSHMVKRVDLKRNKFIPARSGRIGLGVNLFNDRNGKFTNTGLTMSYAYHISFPNAQLSFGLAGSLAQYKVDINNTDFGTDFDPKQTYITKPFYVPDISVGTFYSTRDFYAGFSAAELLENSVKFGNQSVDTYRMKRHYYFLSGYKFANRTDVSYEPSVLLKTTESFFPQMDLSLKVFFYDNYWLGMSYRTANTVIFFMGIKKSFIYAGYSFDYGFNSFQRYTFGSHELNISLKFGDTSKRYRWMNRF
jgi:type IX secretion system PorP/SprF family membrane protein